MTKISLLPKREEATPGEKFFRFCLTFGRYIVICTEIVVIVCFLARFRLDRDLENLSESISEKQAVVQSFSEREREIRRLQTQLSEIKKLTAAKKDSTRLLVNITTLLPENVFLENLAVQGKNLKISAISYSNPDLAIFLDRIRLSTSFREPTLGEVVVDRGKIKFSLSTVLMPDAYD
jgi:Tfp pilus assembly protein PilN